MVNREFFFIERENENPVSWRIKFQDIAMKVFVCVKRSPLVFCILFLAQSKVDVGRLTPGFKN